MTTNSHKWNLGLMLLAALLLVVGPGCRPEESAPASGKDNPATRTPQEHEEHEHGGHDHEGHDHPEVPLDQLEARRCEHDMGQLKCDECRYELGVVKVPEDVAAELLETVKVPGSLSGAATLDLRCETGVDEQNSMTVVALASGRVEKIVKTLGETVREGDVMAVVYSDEFAAFKLAHLKAHQALELAEARLARVSKVQNNLKELLGQLRRLDQAELDLEALAALEIGRAKSELMTAAHGYLRALADGGRDQRLVADGRKLVAHLRGEGKAKLKELRVGSWKGPLLEARAELRYASKTYDRAQTLREKGVVSQGEVERTRRDRDTASARLRAALEQVELEVERMESATTESVNTARARLHGTVEEVLLGLDIELLEAKQDVDRWQMEKAVTHRKMSLFGMDSCKGGATACKEDDEAFGKMEVRAPAAGVVLEHNIALGEMLSKGDRLFEIANLDRLWTWCDVYEKDLERLERTKLPILAEIRTDAYPQQVFPGKLDYLHRRTDEHSRTVKARVQTDNPGKLLRPQMFVKARVSPQGTAAGLAIPVSAVVSDDGVDFVFLQWKDHYWVRRNVEVAERGNAKALITSGVNPGDTIAVKGAFFLKSDVLREKMGAGCAD